MIARPGHLVAAGQYAGGARRGLVSAATLDDRVHRHLVDLLHERKVEICVHRDRRATTCSSCWTS
ncbi:MAG: hypothetical protein U0802_25830 [Candidatus Binatia bacterium]